MMQQVKDWFTPHTTIITVCFTLIRLIQQQGETIMGNLAGLQTAVDQLTVDAKATKDAVEAGKLAVETKLAELSAQVVALQGQVATGTVTSEQFDALTASVTAVGDTVKSIGVPTV
jgi:hypothetical protein